MYRTILNKEKPESPCSNGPWMIVSNLPNLWHGECRSSDLDVSMSDVYLNLFTSKIDTEVFKGVIIYVSTQIGKWRKEVLDEDMKRNGEEERELAVERQDTHMGIPAITVVCDGGWCKRSHKHTYNALGGVGVVLGLETRKLLHIGIRNKYCYICNHAETKNEEPKVHGMLQELEWLSTGDGSWYHNRLISNATAAIVAQLFDKKVVNPIDIYLNW